MRTEPDAHENALAKAVVDASFRVHNKLGPGLLESVYETCLSHELLKTKLPIERQVLIPVRYDDLELEAGLRLDVLVDNNLIVEIKAVQEIHAVHRAQLFTYLKLTTDVLDC